MDKLSYPVCWINMARSVDRCEYMIEMLKKHNIENHKRIEAVDGSKLTNINGGKYENINFINKCKNKGTLTQLAVSLSHIYAIKQAWDAGLSEVLIMEDDISLDLIPNWNTTIKDIANNSPNYNIIQLYTNNPIIYTKLINSPSPLYKKIPGPSNIAFFGTLCYLISRRGMGEILARTYLPKVNLFVLNWIHVVADGLIYDMSESYIHTKPLFYSRDDIFVSTVIDNNPDAIVPGTKNVKALVNGSNGYGLTMQSIIKKHYGLS